MQIQRTERLRANRCQEGGTMSAVVNTCALGCAGAPARLHQNSDGPAGSQRLRTTRAVSHWIALAIPAAFLMAAPAPLVGQTAATAFPVRAYEDSNGVDLFS